MQSHICRKISYKITKRYIHNNHKCKNVTHEQLLYKYCLELCKFLNAVLNKITKSL